jgi:hypothetical protein
VSTYTLRIGGGQQAFGGLDVSASGGTLAVSDPGTQLVVGEITQTMSRPAIGGTVTFSFNWTAPLTPGSVTLYASGNSVDGNSSPSGDNATATTLTVTVAAAAMGPGETSGPDYSQLEVTAYDQSTEDGDISLSYGTACETTSNNIYYGPLSQVSTYGWSGEECNIGANGAYDTFNPGPGSFFFVVVGTKGTDEGSYGTDLRSGGSQSERDPFDGNLCGQDQTLANTCD